MTAAATSAAARSRYRYQPSQMPQRGLEGVLLLEPQVFSARAGSFAG